MRHALSALILLLALPAMAATRPWMPVEAGMQPEPAPAVAVVSVQTGLHAQTGDSITIPVAVTQFDGVYGVDLSIAFDEAVLDAYDVQGATFTEGMTLVFNVRQSGVVHIALYGIYPTVGDGDLVRIRFHVAGGAGASTPISITRCSFDEGRLPCEVFAGDFTVSE